MTATTYTADLGQEICRRLAEGESLRAICQETGMPSERTVRTWAMEHPLFAPQYERARMIGYHGIADEILTISDEPAGNDMAAIQRNRLRVDSRKWLLSKMLPKIYGDRVEATTRHEFADTPGQENLSGFELARHIAFALASGIEDQRKNNPANDEGDHES